MVKYLLKRIVLGILSITATVAIVMVLVYSLMNREQVFASDSLFIRQANNDRYTYMNKRWEEFGYLDYVTYQEWLLELTKNGEIDEETRSAAVMFGRTPDKDPETAAEYVEKFTQYYESQGYTVSRRNAVVSGRSLAPGGGQVLYATKDIPLINRLVSYFSGLIGVDSVHYVEENYPEAGLENPGVTFTWYDPLYGGKKFSPALIGNGTLHKYLIYCDNKFPFIHQNFVSINLGTSYSVNYGVDVFTTMTQSQGSYVTTEVTYPTGYVEMSADDLHSAIYRSGSIASDAFMAVRYTDDYTNTQTVRNNPSKVGYSFICGIISTVMAYVLGIPIGVAMALKKEKLIDKIGNAYIIFISAVPSLAYIFMFRTIGNKAFGLPITFDMESTSKLMFVLPIVSLALPSIAGRMQWTRRYMIDQMNSDYVKFARSGGLTEGEIFSKHILKNAIIPITHGIPGALLYAMTGAIITERLYVVPGAGGLLTTAINMYDNGVIIGMTMFYAVLSVTATILGDIVMSVMDPRISYTTKAR